MTTTAAIPGKRIELIGPVSTACCLSKSVIGDVLANVKNWSIGGQLPGYAKMLEAAAEEVREGMILKAREIDADAVVGFRMVTSSVATGAAELIGYGTAAKIITEHNPNSSGEEE